MEATKSSIRETLDEAKSFLAQESPPRLTEADTKANFIEPIIKALGWRGIGVVTREYHVRSSQEFIDYVMRSDTGPLLAVEAKPLQATLTDKAAAQLIAYCSVEGIEWAVLTNGKQLEFFNTFLKPDLAAKRVLSLDLLAYRTDEEFDALFKILWLLSHESMTTPTGASRWLNQWRLDRVLRASLSNPSSPAVQQLWKVVSNAEIRATPEDVAQWIGSHLLPPTEDFGLAGPTRRKDDTGRDKGGRRRAEDFDPRTSDVFRGPHARLLPLFDVLREAVGSRVPSASWRARKYYLAAASQGETFLAFERRGGEFVLGLTLPPDTAHPRLTNNDRMFTGTRITKLARVANPSDIDEQLLALIDEASRQAGTARTSRFFGYTLRDLLDARLLKANERIVLMHGKHEVAEAHVSGDGAVIWQGRAYRSPSDRDFAALMGRQSLNGWTSWFVEQSGSWRSLHDLRTQLVAKDSSAGETAQSDVGEFS